MPPPWVHSLFCRPGNRATRRTKRMREMRVPPACSLRAELLEDRVVPAPLPLYSGQDFLGDIAVFNRQDPADTSGQVNAGMRTWLVIHGRESERGSDDMQSLSLALAQARPGDQVLTLD